MSTALGYLHSWEREKEERKKIKQVNHKDVCAWQPIAYTSKPSRVMRVMRVMRMIRVIRVIRVWV